MDMQNIAIIYKDILRMTGSALTENGRNGESMKVVDHDEAEKTCFTCSNAFVDEDELIICCLDGRSRDDDQTCDEWN